MDFSHGGSGFNTELSDNTHTHAHTLVFSHGQFTSQVSGAKDDRAEVTPRDKYGWIELETQQLLD